MVRFAAGRFLLAAVEPERPPEVAGRRVGDVHERHADCPDICRLAGWWGHDPASRFRMGPEFVPADGADGWQLASGLHMLGNLPASLGYVGTLVAPMIGVAGDRIGHRDLDTEA